MMCMLLCSRLSFFYPVVKVLLPFLLEELEQ